MKRSAPVEQLQLPMPELAAPEVNVKVEPVIEVNAPAADMGPIAEALNKFMERPEPNVNVTVQEAEKDIKPKTVKVEVTERDNRGFIKSLVCTSVEA